MYVNELVLFCCLLLFLYFACGAAEDKVDSKEACVSRIPSCQNDDGHKPVCGTNGRNYPSRCQLLKSRCSGEAVSVAHKGPCLDGQSCHIALQYAMSASQGSRKATFVPRCRADGTYASVQCAGASGGTAGCWCVTPNGKPLPDTAVRNGRPDCTRTGKSHTKRRSSARGQRNKKSCTRTDRIQFNQNLIKIFSGEHDMAKETEAALEPRAIADWKFKKLDKDRSGALQKPEYRGLRRLVKKMVKPKRCARAWAKGCDADGNGAIARAEWLACLLATPDPPEHDYEERAPAPEHDYEDEPPPVDASAVYGGTLMRQSFAPDGADSDGRRDDETNDCLTDRQAVLDEQKIGGAALYVPECMGDGRYARAQCYRTTPYCWCVHQDTGKPIPGSSVKDRRPDCDAAPQHSSPMRGCPGPMKTNFLRNLMQMFLTRMTSATNGTGPGPTEMVKWGASKEEQTATWTFVMLDKDKNKVLERREWRAFHQLINRTEQLRRCGKKLPRYCDVNHDNGISITEWLACLEVAQASQVSTTEPTKAPTNNRRKGPNPLESFLKADD